MKAADKCCIDIVYECMYIVPSYIPKTPLQLIYGALAWVVLSFLHLCSNVWVVRNRNPLPILGILTFMWSRLSSSSLRVFKIDHVC